ncbi:MAG: hypothetical protein KAI47_21855 [Deltaproteobacteria bacterium]|nr:hypothetical protein [Deltaproteobacteria bacterium]
MWNSRRAALSPRLLRVTFALFGLSVMSGCNPKPNPQGEQCIEITGMPSMPKGTIVVDGDTDDWAGIAPQLTRKDGKPTTAPYHFTALHVAADDAKIFLWVDIASDGITSPDSSITSPDSGITSSQCGNGRCEPGENITNCHHDCMPPDLRINVKTSGFRQGEIYSVSFGGPLKCQGNWWSDHGEEQKNIDCSVSSRPTPGGFAFELSFDRAELGALVSLYPTLGHPQNGNSPTIIDDEIGCVWWRADSDH